MVKIDELFADLSFLEEATVKPRANPPEPEAGKRNTYLLTFDWSEGDTDGMLDALREAGFFAWAKSRYPRTSIVCRTGLATKEAKVLEIVCRGSWRQMAPPWCSGWVATRSASGRTSLGRVSARRGWRRIQG